MTQPRREGAGGGDRAYTITIGPGLLDDGALHGDVGDARSGEQRDLVDLLEREQARRLVGRELGR